LVWRVLFLVVMRCCFSRAPCKEKRGIIHPHRHGRLVEVGRRRRLGLLLLLLLQRARRPAGCL
jgi:hypothetical protein